MKKYVITISCILLSVGLGYINSTMIQGKSVTETHFASSGNSSSSAEELSKPELIIKGTVIEELPTVRRETGLINSTKVDTSYLVSPVKVEIEEVVSGEITTKEITYLQRTEVNDKIKKGDTVILMLHSTTDGFFWSYNFNDGIWLEDSSGNVNSKSEAKVFQNFKKMDSEEFIVNIKEELTKE
jgi:hypothetical protein